MALFSILWLCPDGDKRVLADVLLEMVIRERRERERRASSEQGPE